MARPSNAADHSFPATQVSKLLGWQAIGNAFAQSDELERPLRLTKGATLYQRSRGGITIRYDDGDFAFAGGLIRSGTLPTELIQLSDLGALLKSGRYPTIYALLEPEHERFAEFGAWFTFNQIKGTLDSFRRIHPTLYTFYGEKLRSAEND